MYLLSKMKLCRGILASFLLLLTAVKTQKIRYATRFRNFTIVSDTNSTRFINMTIFQHGMDHRFGGFFEVTKEIRAKNGIKESENAEVANLKSLLEKIRNFGQRSQINIHVVVHRCFFEKSACEYFQTWKFSENLKGVVYMKNQIWTPIFTSVKPKLDFPVVKAAVYQASNVYLNTEALVLFYPDVVKYYWQADAIVHDMNDKRAAVLKFDFAIYEFVERKRKQ